MEESVALDSSQQKQFVKSVRGIKKLLKKKSKKSEEQGATKTKTQSVKKEAKLVENVKQKKIKRKPRGLVYLSHIPHGFYEHQMTEYFKQFGVVTNARVIRSKRTGNSKGYAFVEFKEISVAKIVAETMNNYLMGKRLIKAVFIPPKKQKINALRKNWNFQTNPASKQRLNIRKAYNANKTDEAELKIARNLLARLSKTKAKLNEIGIDYDFFKPVDVPKVLEDIVDKNNDKETNVNLEKKSQKKLKSESAEEKTVKDEKKIKIEPKGNDTNKLKNKKQKNVSQSIKSEPQLNDKSDIITVKAIKSKPDINKEMKNNKGQNKKDKIKMEDIKPLENFISVKNDTSDDEDDDFDSDEFEKMMENDDDDVLSNDESDENDDDSENEEIDDNSDQSEDKVVKQGSKGNKKPQPKNSLKKTTLTTLAKNVAQEKATIVTRQTKKRTNVQSTTVAQKKAKFEKQKKKPLKNVVKKKK
ncbi:unnamed protein product, partial [Brenthis ino]